MKNKKLAVLLALAAALSLSLCAGFAESGKIKVTGQGTVSLQADTVSFTIGVMTQDEDLSKAHEKNKSDMEKLIATLKQQGIDEKDMLTTSYNIDLNRNYGEKNDKVTYTISNMLYVVLRNVDSLNDVMEAAMQNGANNLWSLSFSSSKEDEAYDKALEIAMQKAQKNAEVLAKASNRKLGQITEINQSSWGPAQYGVFNNMDMVSASEKAAGALISGDVSVSATVELTFELEAAPIMP